MTDKWYHVTYKNLGTSPTMECRTPSVAFHLGTEPKTPRVCVAPSIKQCLISIAGLKSKQYVGVWESDKDKLFVYSSDKHPDKSARELVKDAELTGEHWYLNDTQMFLEGELDIDELNNSSSIQYKQY